MDSLDKVRARQRVQKHPDSKENLSKSGSLQGKSATKTGTNRVSQSNRGGKNCKKSNKARAVVGLALKIAVVFVLVMTIFCGIWIARNIDFSFGDDFNSMNLHLSSCVFYVDEDGEQKRYEDFVAAENRIWVDIDKIPDQLQKAFVAIEDQRFYSHRGVDLKRTTGATLNYILRGDSSYGGSTITQQLVKNVTNDSEHTKSRKIREMLRAIVLESKVSKEQILEMYLNTIYLSQGTNGVQAASHMYFSKDVSELSLAESACIAGITQYPATYDPITNPDNNAKKRKLVLDKMLQLKFITQDEHDKAVNEKIVIKKGKRFSESTQSYFMDALFEELMEDLKAKGYSEQFASNLIYNGGLEIHATVDPKVQDVMEKVYTNDSNFPNLGGNTKPQSAMVISDPQTGQVKGIIGGRGKKTGNRVLNRATQTTRQPGSSIKPIAVYGPAVDLGLVTPGTSVEDSPIEIAGWKPKNSNNTFRGYMSVRTALTYSYNIPAVRVLERLTVDNSYKYLKDNLHISTLVSNQKKGGKVYTDRNLSSLALGGLTNGVTVMDMNAAYATFANEGKYIEPSLYTKVYDSGGRILLEKSPKQNKAFSKETAYILSSMLKDVVTRGTGAGAQISNMDTCGKTGTTDDNKDRWFIGYTPYYVGSVWFGYDEQRQILSGGTNPSLVLWKKVMEEIHKPLPARHFKKPDTVERISVCNNSGKKPTYSCRISTDLVNINLASKTCSGVHHHIGTKSTHSNYITTDQNTSGEANSDEESTTNTSDDNNGSATDENALQTSNPGTQTNTPPANQVNNTASTVQ